MAEPVTPDREAPGLNVDKLYEVASEALRKWGDDQHDSDAVMAVDVLLPLLTDALDRARQQGRDEAAAAIEAAIVRRPIDPAETVTARTMRQIHADWDLDAARLARGGPNRKDDE